MFGIFGKKFKRTAAAANVEMRKIENKDLMEAAVGAVAYICFANGAASTAELNKVENIIRTSKKLESFGGEAMESFRTWCKRFESSHRNGKIEALREMSDLANEKRDAEDALLMAIEVAFADGECDEVERKALDELAEQVNLSAERYI